MAEEKKTPILEEEASAAAEVAEEKVEDVKEEAEAKADAAEEKAEKKAPAKKAAPKKAEAAPKADKAEDKEAEAKADDAEDKAEKKAPAKKAPAKKADAAPKAEAKEADKKAPAKKAASKKADKEDDEADRPQGKTVAISSKKPDPKKVKVPEKGTLKITLKKALTGRNQKQIAVAHSLGLRRVSDVTIQPDNAATQGKLAKIGFLLKVERP